VPRGCAISLLALVATAGIALALLAMAFLVVNETQVDVAQLARESRAIRPDDPAARPGELVSLTGTIDVNTPLGDGLLLAPGQYLTVERIVEMYAWDEERAGEDGDGRPRYKQRKVWTRSPERGLLSNPPMPFKGGTFTAGEARIGEVVIPLKGADLPLATGLALQERHLLPGTHGRIEDGYLYIGVGSLAWPRVGDLRVSYKVVAADQLVTVFAALDGGRMAPYPAADGQAILRVVAGEREAALRDVGAVQQIAGWIVRLVAGAALWLGLLLLLAGSRRLVPWPRWLGVTLSSARLAALLGLPTVLLTVGSLWLSQGSLAVLAAMLGAEALVLLAWPLLRQRARPAPAARPHWPAP